MQYKYKGESLRLVTVLTDFNGTSLDSETPILSIEDATGSNVFNGTGTFDTAGSYYVQTPIASAWGTGPVNHWWTIKGANGTAKEIRTNEILILEGTSELPAYVYEAELSNYYSGIEDYDLSQASYKITERYHYINRLLDTLGITTLELRILMDSMTVL